MYSDHVGGVVIPFPQRARAPVVQRVYFNAAANWRARAVRAAQEAAAATGEAFVAALIAAMMAADAWLLAAAFGVAL